MLNTLARAGVAEDVGRVAGAVVGEQLLDGHPQASVVDECPPKECDAGSSTFIGQDLRVQRSRCVVDGDVDEFPARSARAVATVTGDAMTDTLDSP
jgi:hypothetical protein